MCGIILNPRRVIQNSSGNVELDRNYGVASFEYNGELIQYCIVCPLWSILVSGTLSLIRDQFPCHVITVDQSVDYPNSELEKFGSKNFHKKHVFLSIYLVVYIFQSKNFQSHWDQIIIVKQRFLLKEMSILSTLVKTRSKLVSSLSQ